MQSADLAFRNVLVVGAGLMGHGIAQLLALRGCSVTLSDVSREALCLGMEQIEWSLRRLAQWGHVEQDQVAPALARIRLSADLQEAAREIDFAIEAVTENLALKQDIFRQLDEFSPAGAILATNTSVISISEIAEKCIRKQRVVGTHFWNPPMLIPLVEVVPGRETSEQTMAAVVSFLGSVGKHPVRLKKDVPGFVGNRLQHALWREAISIVEQGIAEPDVVDEVVKFGFGMRLPVLGPLENAELVGLDLTLAIHEYLFCHLENSKNPSPLLVEKVREGALGFKSGHGLRAWSPERMGKVRADLETHILESLAKQK